MEFLNMDLVLQFAARLFLAAFLGVAISFRRHPNKSQQNLVEAHAILSTAGAIFMLVIAGDVVRAVGLLGAASVVRYRYAIRNPRDAGTLIIALGLGMACGSGLLEIAVVGGVFIILVTRVLALFPEMLPLSMVKRRENRLLRIETDAYEDTLAKVKGLFDRYDIRSTVVNYERKVSVKRGPTVELRFRLNHRADLDLDHLRVQLMDEHIVRICWG